MTLGGLMEAVDILKQYAKEKSVIVRSTSDLSPLEEWLLIQLLVYKKISQPDVEAGAELPKCCRDMKPDPLGYDCVCPICGRTA